MTFQMQCHNKECRKFTEPLLDESNDTIVCGDCFVEIKNVTVFVKNQLRSSRQIKKKTAHAKAFAVKCKWCSSSDAPILKGDKLFCTTCDKDMECTIHFVNMFKLKAVNNI